MYQHKERLYVKSDFDPFVHFLASADIYEDIILNHPKDMHALQGPTL
jgi:hypothetical protein